MMVSNGYTTKYLKSEKVDERSLKNVKMVKDGDSRNREIGEVDLINVSQKELIGVFGCLNNIKDSFNYLTISLNDGKCESNKEMEKYFNMLEKELNMESKDLFGLLKSYLVMNKNQKKYKAFTELLNATCKLVYEDYDGYVYYDYDEHPHPLQKDVDHNYVGDYSLILVKPIPFKTIEVLKNGVERLQQEVKRLQEKERQKTLNNFDKKHSTAELDELSNIL